MSALLAAEKLGREQSMARIAAAELAVIPGHPKQVIAGLYNSDLDGAWLALLEMEPEKLIGGILALGYAAGVERMTLYLPELSERMRHVGDEGFVKACEAAGIRVERAFIDRRAHKNSCFCSLPDAVRIACMLTGEDFGFTYVSVNDGALRKIQYGSLVSDILGDSAESFDYLEIDGVLYDSSALERPIESFGLRSGIIRTIAGGQCIVHEMVERLLGYRKQSCGKCVFCREGLIQLHTMAGDIAMGKGRPAYLPLMREIADAMRISAVCTLGAAAAESWLHAMEAGEDEFLTHIKKRKCPGGICISSEAVYIDPKTCTGCGACVGSCPVDCIDGKPGCIHLLYDLDCTKCGICIESCPERAIVKTDSRMPKLPDRMIRAGMFRP